MSGEERGGNGGGSDDTEERGFAAALGDVKPLRDRDKLRSPPEPAVGAPRPAPPRPRHFVIEREGDDVFARGTDVSRRRLADLRAGRIAPQREVDLHGMTASSARSVLLDTLALAQQGGARCVLVIHGAGHHSPGSPVLKAALPDWLQEDAIAREVLAFATAPARLGGPGASLVLLRRPRRR